MKTLLSSSRTRSDLTLYGLGGGAQERVLVKRSPFAGSLRSLSWRRIIVDSFLRVTTHMPLKSFSRSYLRDPIDVATLPPICLYLDGVPPLPRNSRPPDGGDATRIKNGLPPALLCQSSPRLSLGSPFKTLDSRRRGSPPRRLGGCAPAPRDSELRLPLQLPLVINCSSSPSRRALCLTRAISRPPVGSVELWIVSSTRQKLRICLHCEFS